MKKLIDFLQPYKILLIKHRFFIKLCFMFLFIWLVLSQIDLEESIKLFSNVNYLILVPFFLYLPGLFLSTLKWEGMIKYPFWKLFRIYWMSNFFSNFLPSPIGGDAYKVVKLGPELGKTKVLTSVLLDRLSGIAGTLLLLIFLSYKILPFFYLEVKKISFIFLFIVIFLFALIIYFFSSKLKGIVLKIKNHIKEMNLNWFRVVSISIIYPLLGSLSLWIYLLMFGYNTDYLLVTGFYLVIQLISIVPISVNAIGVYELSLISLLSFIGISAEASLSISLLSRFIMLIQTSIGGIFYFFNKKD